MGKNKDLRNERRKSRKISPPPSPTPPEPEPQTPHEQLLKDLRVLDYLPQQTRDRLELLGDQFEKFEQAAFETMQDRVATNQLFEIIDACGGFSAGIMEMWEQFAIEDCAILQTVLTLLRKQRRPSADYERAYKEFSETHIQLMRKLMEHHRPILKYLLAEAGILIKLFQMQEDARILGARFVMNKVLLANENGPIPDDEDSIAGWMILASDTKDSLERGPAEPFQEKYSYKEIQALCRDITFQPEGKTIEIPLPHWKIKGIPVLARFNIPNNPTPATLICVELRKKGGEILQFLNVSRFTGELNVNGSDLVSLKFPFEQYGVTPSYEQLRSDIWNVLYEAIESNRIKQEEFITQNDIWSILPNGKPATSVETFPIPFEDPALLPTVDEAPEEETPLEQVIPPGSIETIPPDETKQKKKPKIQFRERRINWRNIMSAFDSFGVKIIHGAHPKLTYNNLTSRFLNEHDKDVKHNKRELMRVLKDLHIDPVIFLPTI